MLKHLWKFAAVALLVIPATHKAADDDIDELQEKAIKAAAKEAGASVVKIETAGGTEVVKGRGPKGLIRRGTGPTTGLVVSADGYIITSAFNFANKPTSILVTIPGVKERKVAKVVATDLTRMLTLLKVAGLAAGTKLTLPKATPKKEIKVGYTAIACGRTLTADASGLPSVSVGIISALDRIWGKMVQTDAKVSPTNYGGPLIDLQGRVVGLLVPASPQAEGELAGYEWYDSGIGFAVPLEDINRVLPRMLKGTEKNPITLRRGYLGILPKATDTYEAQPVIGSVQPGSPAEKAGIKAGDLIKSIDGKTVLNYNQVMHRLASRYEGDFVALKLERDKKEVTLDKVELGSGVAAFPQAFLGIVPMRDDPNPGVEIRYVYPKSPAEGAKLKAGDRIMKISSPILPLTSPLLTLSGGTAGNPRDQLLTLMELAKPQQSLKIEVKRKDGGKTETLTVKLTEMPDVVPNKLPEKATAKNAKIAGEKKPDTGLIKKTTAAADHTYWIYVPDNYDPKMTYSVVIWLHPLGKGKEKDIEDFTTSWSSYCDDNNIIMLCPQSDDAKRGWTSGEAAFVQQTLKSVVGTYNVDKRRIVAHGMGVGGDMAYYLGFQSAGAIRGIAPLAAAMGSNPREKLAGQTLSFFLLVGAKDPVKTSVATTKQKLVQYKYPTILEEVPNMGHEYIDGKAGVSALEKLVRWIDSLDRL